jgi:hypothetical protein
MLPSIHRLGVVTVFVKNASGMFRDISKFVKSVPFVSSILISEMQHTE